MPLVHNDAASTTHATITGPGQSFASSLNALKSAQESDSVIYALGYARAREALAAEIARGINLYAEGVVAGQNNPTDALSWKTLGCGGLTPEDARFTPEQFTSRGFDTVSTLLAKHKGEQGRNVLERELLAPIKEQLEAAGFSDVHFSFEKEKRDYKSVDVLALRLKLPQS